MATRGQREERRCAPPRAGLKHTTHQYAFLMNGMLAPVMHTRVWCVCAGGDVKAARQAVLEQPYADVPPAGHHIHRVGHIRALSLPTALPLGMSATLSPAPDSVLRTIIRVRSAV